MTKIPVGLAAGVWSDEVRPWVQHYLYDLKLKRIEVAAEHFDEVHDAMKLTARHLLGILAEDGKLLQHETYLAVLRNELGEVGRSFPAIEAIIVEEGDTLTSPFGLPATKLDFAWKICSARLAIPLSCRAWRMAGDGIGQDRAGERGQAPKAGADEGGARQRLRRQA